MLRRCIVLQVDKPQEAINDTTAVIEAIQGMAAPGDKQLKDLLYKAIFRRVPTHVQTCHENRQAIPMSS